VVRFIVQAMPERTSTVDYLKRHIPTLEVCWDRLKWPFGTFMDALRLANDEPCVHLEDDIILTVDFVREIEEVIAARPNALIQFFSMRKADQTTGSRWDRNFAMNQCWYSPEGYSTRFLAFAARWMADNPEGKHSGYDTMMNAALKDWKTPHWIHVPSLVQHREGKSLIGPRSSKRQSATFMAPTKDS
jgi:hypothetical protein